MAVNTIFNKDPGLVLAQKIYDPTGLLTFDFAFSGPTARTFTALPTTATMPLAEGSADPTTGLAPYVATITPTPESAWPDGGGYLAVVYDMSTGSPGAERGFSSFAMLDGEEVGGSDVITIEVPSTATTYALYPSDTTTTPGSTVSVAVVPVGGALTGAVTLAASGAGVNPTAVTLTFGNSAAGQVAGFVVGAVGTLVVSGTNTGGVADPAGKTIAVAAAATPTIPPANGTNLFSAILAQLKAYAPLVTELGETTNLPKIFLNEAEDNTRLPYVVFSLMASTPEFNTSKVAGYNEFIDLQFSAYAATSGAAIHLGNLIRAALDFAQPTFDDGIMVSLRCTGGKYMTEAARQTGNARVWRTITTYRAVVARSAL